MIYLFLTFLGHCSSAPFSSKAANKFFLFYWKERGQWQINKRTGSKSCARLKTTGAPHMASGWQAPWPFWPFFRFFLRKSGVRPSWLSTDRAGSTSPFSLGKSCIKRVLCHLPQRYLSLFEGGGVDVVCHPCRFQITFEFGRMSEILEPQEPFHGSSLSQWPFQEANLEHI